MYGLASTRSAMAGVRLKPARLDNNKRYDTLRMTRTRSGATVRAAHEVHMLGSREALDALLESSKGKKVVLNVSSSKCGPCKLLMPTLQKYADEHGDKCTFAKFNFDEDKSLQDAVKEWKIQGVPTYRLYNEKGECTKMLTTGLPDKLGSALYLFLT